MPKGRPKKSPIVLPPPEASAPVFLKPKTAEVENAKVEIKEEVKEEIKVDVLKQSQKIAPLNPGQKYFEAPDGTIIIGEETKTQVWYRQGNGGKGAWINPKR